MEPSWSEQDGTPNRRLLALVLEKWPFFLLSAASCVITFVAQRAEAVVSLEPYPLVARLGNALLAYVGYLRKMVWPADLAVIYPLSVHVSWGGAALAGLFLAAVSWCAWRRRRERPWRLVGWLWYLGMLVPVIGLVQVGGQAMADRYTYLPLIGIFLALVFEASYWADRLSLARAVPALAAGLALAGCVAMTIRQLGFWRDSQSLFTHALAVTQANPIAHVNLGVALEQAGQRQEARRQYEAALRLAPRLVEAHNGLGNVLQADGRLDAALAQYREAVRLKPSALLPHLNLATLLARLGQYDEAMKECAAAARLGPRDPRPRLLLGKVLLRQRRSPEAVRELHAALALAPNDAQTIVLLARVLASDPDARARNGPAAVALARQALALAGGDSALLLDTLAMALAETGRFDEARAAAQQALDQAATDNDTEAVAALRDRLRLYESRQPWRDTAEGGKQ
jgi:Tfp pilus assembly protein PilF